MHVYGCGNKLVMEADNHSVGLLLRLCTMVLHVLACYIIIPHGSDGCRVAFAASDYAPGARCAQLDGVVVRLVVVYHHKHKTE